MNKRTKNLIILFAVAAVLAVACFLLSSLNKEDGSKEPEAEPIVVAEIDSSAVTALRYRNDNVELSFKCNSGGWVYEADPEFPVTQNIITTMISDVAVVYAERELADVTDLSEYGLDDPALAVYVTCGEKEHAFMVGDLNDYSGLYYLKYDDKIYLTDELLVSTFSKDLYDYLTVTDLPALESIVGFSVGGIDITNEAAVSDLASSYDKLIRGDVVDYCSKESYGFDGTEHKVVVKYSEKKTVSDANGSPVSNVDVEYTYSFSYAYVGENAYIMLQDDDLIYEVSGTTSFDLIDA